jgi:hypothetical protein
MPEDVHWGPGNPHPLSQMRTEMVWEGKYDEYGRRREVDVAGFAMPLQKIETVDEPASRLGDQAGLLIQPKPIPMSFGIVSSGETTSLSWPLSSRNSREKSI